MPRLKQLYLHIEDEESAHELRSCVILLLERGLEILNMEDFDLQTDDFLKRISEVKDCKLEDLVLNNSTSNLSNPLSIHGLLHLVSLPHLKSFFTPCTKFLMVRYNAVCLFNDMRKNLGYGLVEIR